MKEIDRKWIAWAIIVALILVSTITGVKLPIPAPPIPLGYSHFTGLHVAAPTTQPTATPAAIINSEGLGTLLEVQDAATRVFWIEDGGQVRGTYWTVSFEAADTALTSTQDPVYTFQLPFAVTLIEATAACRDIDVADTDETYVLALEDDGVAITSAWAVVADNTIDAATITTATIADNSVLETTLTLAGTSPSAEDCYGMLTFKVQ